VAGHPIFCILYILGRIIAGIILILIVLAFVPITIDLSEHKGVVESAATMALGRSVQIDDKIIITTSLQPYFSFERLQIANLEGFQAGDFLRMKEARRRIRVLPLLRGKLHITEIRVDGLSLVLVENETIGKIIAGDIILLLKIKNHLLHALKIVCQRIKFFLAASFYIE